MLAYLKIFFPLQENTEALRKNEVPMIRKCCSSPSGDGNYSNWEKAEKHFNKQRGQKVISQRRVTAQDGEDGVNQAEACSRLIDVRRLR